MNNQFLGPMLGYLLVVLIVLAVIFLVLRELVCWYWKINEHIALLTEIRDLLAKGQSPTGSTSTAPMSGGGQYSAQRDRETTELAARKAEQERLDALKPQGHCPSCEAVIPLDSDVCPRCEAQFTGSAVWKVKPL